MKTHYGKAALEALNQSALMQIREWCVEARETLDTYSRGNDSDISEMGNRASVNDDTLAALRIAGNELDADRAKFAALANAIEALYVDFKS